MPSFDVKLDPNLESVDNAVNTTAKEIGTRFDFKGSSAAVEFKKKGKSIPVYYYPIDTHFNKKGYALFGETIYEKIEELGFLK